MTEGYGRNWTNWDAYVAHKWPKPEDVRYSNWYPFKSPKGRWMAFYGKSYTDICIIDLETKEVVVRDFYARYRGSDKVEIEGKITYVPRPDHVYDGGHCNTSTYVPSYAYSNFKTKTGTDSRWLCSVLEDYDFDTFDPADPEGLASLQSSSFERFQDSLTIASVPIAFNSYTFWAADYCLFVDLIDLSEVDNGIIKLFDSEKYEIPHGASHVRNYVDCDFNGEDDPNKPFTIDMSFKIMSENGGYRFSHGNGQSELGNYHSKPKIKKHTELLPWQEVQKRLKEYEAEKAAKQAK